MFGSRRRRPSGHFGLRASPALVDEIFSAYIGPGTYPGSEGALNGGTWSDQDLRSIGCADQAGWGISGGAIRFMFFGRFRQTFSIVQGRIQGEFSIFAIAIALQMRLNSWHLAT